MTFHANDFDRYPISLVLCGFFQPKKRTVFSLIKLYFRPRWTLNGSQKTSSVSDCMIISEKTTNNSLFDFCFRFPPSDRSHFPPSSAPCPPLLWSTDWISTKSIISKLFSGTLIRNYIATSYLFAFRLAQRMERSPWTRRTSLTNGRNVHKVDHEEFTSFADQFAFRSWPLATLSFIFCFPNPIWWPMRLPSESTKQKWHLR